MDKAELMDIIDGESRLRDVELRAVLRKCILLHEERHHITTRQKLHDEVEVDRILANKIESWKLVTKLPWTKPGQITDYATHEMTYLEGVKHLDNPGVVGFN